MRILVCGSRHFNDRQRLFDVLSRLQPSEIIHGGARGADTLGGEYAKANNISCREFPALWDLHGKRAGPIRNYQMLREGAPEMVVAFLAPNSRGTKHMVDIATKANIPVQIEEIE